jgi:hypothetical protein
LISHISIFNNKIDGMIERPSSRGGRGSTESNGDYVTPPSTLKASQSSLSDFVNNRVKENRSARSSGVLRKKDAIADDASVVVVIGSVRRTNGRNISQGHNTNIPKIPWLTFLLIFTVVLSTVMNQASLTGSEQLVDYTSHDHFDAKEISESLNIHGEPAQKYGHRVHTTLAPLNHNADPSHTIMSPLNQNPNPSHLEESLGNTDDGTPIMSTFYQRVEDAGGGHILLDTDEEILGIWKSAWSDAGWETRILTMEDARRHPRFDYYAKKLEVATPGIHEPVDYNKVCFYRWLAMTTVQGGWLSDYDVIPLPKSYNNTRELPYDGDFTVHEWGTHPVPSLVSGSKSEWDRMVGNLFQTAVNQAHGVVPSSLSSKRTSDMVALWSIMASIEMKQDVESQPEDTMLFDESICARLKTMRAVHFSHRSIYIMAKRNDHVAVESRPKLMTEWMQLWKSKCSGYTDAENQ